MSTYQFGKTVAYQVGMLLVITLFTIVTPGIGNSAVVQLPATGQTNCYDLAGAVIPCAGTGQDADLLQGVAWPVPRFTDNGNQTVTDRLTGLIWTKDANVMATRDPVFDADGLVSDGMVTWQHALDYVKKLNTEQYLGFSDWRLPNRNELSSIFYNQQDDYAAWFISQGIVNAQTNEAYWSSGTVAFDVHNAWSIMAPGYVFNDSKTLVYFVWPVRGGQGGAVTIPQTGQTTCYDAAGAVMPCAGTGQDGELQQGAVWPNPRFTDNGDGTTTDNLTGLVWGGREVRPTVCQSVITTWQQALDYVACLNINAYLGKVDWRLPNRTELESLANQGESSSVRWLQSQGVFPVIPLNRNNIESFWTSGTAVPFPSGAWVVNLGYGDAFFQDKSFTNNLTYSVVPVRNSRGDQVALSIAKGGNGTGTIIPSSGAITWNGVNGTANFASGTTVTLTTVPDNVSTVVDWAGCDTSAGNTCTVTMTSSSKVSAILSTHLSPAIPLADYNISEIPPQTGWAGNPVTFYVHSGKLGASAALSYTVSQPPPTGAIAFDPVTRLFSYSPGPSDERPFEVTFIATLGFDTDAQTVVVTPLPEVVPEVFRFGVEPDLPKVPNPDDPNYIVQKVKTNNSPINYRNPATQTSRSVTISGKRIVFQKNHANNLYNNYNSDGKVLNVDISDMTIYADTVVFRSPMRLPQTNVTIYARELRFEDPVGGFDRAYLNTTPIDNPSPTAAGAINSNGTITPAIPGVTGLKGGDIKLHIQSFYADSSLAPRLVMHGGTGQNAGAGLDGLPGHSITTTYPTCQGVYASPYGADTTYVDVEDQRCSGGFCVIYTLAVCGIRSDWQPSSGGPATSPGLPGIGGQGGNLFLNGVVLPNSSFVNSGGLAGIKARDAVGGAPGTPRRAVDVLYNAWVGQAFFGFAPYTMPGADAPAPSALKPFGDPGAVVQEGNVNDWLHPTVVKMVLIYAKDLYLHGFIDDTRAILTDYQLALDAYRATPEWLMLSSSDQLDLDQMNSEIRVMLHRIASNMDYFGNPVGWVPMLSFEANLAIFNGEIENALRTWYLTYWLQEKAATLIQKRDAMGTAITSLLAEIGKQRNSMNTTIGLLSGLSNEIAAISGEIDIINRFDLPELEQRLLARAQTNVADRYRLPEWQKGLRFMGGAMQMIPVPQAQAIGFGLTTLSKINSKSDPAAVIGMIQSYDKTKYDQYNNDWQTLSTNINKFPAQLDSTNAAAYATTVRDSFAPIADKLMQLKDLLQETQVPRDEIQQELDRLKASDPDFLAITAKLQVLLAKKEKFFNDLRVAEYTVTSLTENIHNNLLTVDALNAGILDATKVDAPRLLSYLKEMEHSAKERMLQYQYYLKKAYEYRLLNKYPGNLSLAQTFIQLQTLAQTKITNAPQGNVANVTGGELLSAAEYTSLLNVYKNEIAVISKVIYDDYNANPSQPSPADATYTLSIQEVQDLNAGKTVILNFAGGIGRFRPDYENIRITDLRVDSVTIRPVDLSGFQFADLDFDMAHSGISKLTKNGQVYQFVHYNNFALNPIVWRDTFDAKLGRLNTHTPLNAQPSSQSLLRTLLTVNNGFTIPDMETYSKTAAWADINITRVLNPLSSNVSIDSLVLRLSYDFTPKPVSAATLLVKTSDSALTPFITLNTLDMNGRSDGNGDFFRTYTKGATITATAPITYGTMAFTNWTDGAGVSLGVNPTLTLALATDKTIIANYVSAHTITAIAGANGTISPTATVIPGASATFTITPDANYRVSDVLVDGISMGAVTSYTFTNVTAAHTIEATFAVSASYTIRTTAGANGTISPSIIVNPGASAILTITPDTNCRVVDVLVDGTSVGAVTSYTFTNVTANHSIAATFALMGDLNLSGTVDLADAILAMKVMSAIDLAGQTVTIHADVNEDGKISMAEVIYILQKVAGVR